MSTSNWDGPSAALRKAAPGLSKELADLLTKFVQAGEKTDREIDGLKTKVQQLEGSLINRR